jgi:hypothetical protein
MVVAVERFSNLGALSQAGGVDYHYRSVSVDNMLRDCYKGLQQGILLCRYRLSGNVSGGFYAALSTRPSFSP